MDIIVAYDVDRDHSDIKQACLRSGFTDCTTLSGGRRVRLPNTTLMGVFDSPKAAFDQFTAVARRVSPYVTIEKLIAAEWKSFWMNSNENC